MDDVECIGDISPDVDAQGQWQRADKRSTIASYQFPPQETKLREGAAVLHAPSLQKVGTILSLDSEAGTAEIKRRSEEHTSELQSLMRISYAVFCLKKKKQT